MRPAFRTGWEALFWKEWRQQRVAALLLGLFCLLGYLGYSAAFRWEPERTALLTLLALIAPALGANAFAAEEEDRGAGHSSWLPVPRRRTALARYAVATGFAVLCLVPAYLVFLLLGSGRLRAHLPDWPLALLALLLVGSAVAVTGALTGDGLGGMGALLATGALLGLSQFLALRNGRSAANWQVLAVPWGVSHLWFWRACCRERADRPAVWRRLAWPALLVLAPALLGAATDNVPRFLGTWRARLLYGPRQWARCGELAASPSPDGKTIVLTGRMDPKDGSSYSTSWLLDADTGKIRRVGPLAGNCVFTIWHDEPASWSPDGRQVRLYITPPEDPPANAWDDWLARMEEVVVEVRAGSSKVTRRRSGFRCHWSAWLGNGTNVDWTPTAWEFADPGMGQLRRCAYSPDEKSDVQLGRRAWVKDAIVMAGLDRTDKDNPQLRIWRSAPELARTQRRDIPVDPAIVGDRHPWAVSPDGDWLLAIPPTQPASGALGLFALADGTGRLLTPEDGWGPEYPAFTADGSRLVVPSCRSVQVWNLADGRWEAKTALPESFAAPTAGRGERRFRVAISPQPPWRVAVSADDAPGVYLASLADATLTEVFAVPIPEGHGGRGRRPLWLGNERLLVELQYPYELWVVQSDGSDRRRLLP